LVWQRHEVAGSRAGVAWDEQPTRGLKNRDAHHVTDASVIPRGRGGRAFAALTPHPAFAASYLPLHWCIKRASAGGAKAKTTPTAAAAAKTMVLVPITIETIPLPIPGARSSVEPTGSITPLVLPSPASFRLPSAKAKTPPSG